MSTDIGNHGTVRYTEEWLTEEDLRSALQIRHLRAARHADRGRDEPPRIEFTLAHETRGFDFVEEVRASTP